MTGYTITIGYISGYSFNGNQDDAWQKLVLAANEIRRNPNRIVAEAEYEYPVFPLSPVQFAEQFNSGDLTISFVDREDSRYILMLASGGGEERRMKEIMRRAFIRLLMDDMHKLGIELNVSVT